MLKKQNCVIYMDTDSFIVYLRTDDIYKDIAKDVETTFDTSNVILSRLLSIVI